MSKSKKPNLSYLAGFFDGEGCIRINKTHGHYALIIQVSQCNRWVLELFKMHFGGSIHHREQSRYPSSMWSISSWKASAFLEIIEPYLMLKKLRLL